MGWHVQGKLHRVELELKQKKKHDSPGKRSPGRWGSIDLVLSWDHLQCVLRGEQTGLRQQNLEKKCWGLGPESPMSPHKFGFTPYRHRICEGPSTGESCTEQGTGSTPGHTNSEGSHTGYV